MSFLLYLIDTRKHIVAVSIRKLTMMLPALPEFIMKKEIPFIIEPGLNIGNETVCHTDGIEQDAVRILEYVELYFPQVRADMFCKTGTCKHDLLPVTDPFSRRNDFYWKKKWIHISAE